MQVFFCIIPKPFINNVVTSLAVTCYNERKTEGTGERNMKKKFYIALFVVCLGIFLVSGWKLYEIYHTYQQGDLAYEKIAEDVVVKFGTMPPSKVTDAPEDVDEEEPEEEMISVDFDSLEKINPDVIGWLYIPNSAISYPLLRGTDNDKYLHQTYDGTSSIFGSIFMDFRNAADLSDWHTIIYGHNMKNGSMFGTLKKYQEQSFFRKHRNIYILTKEATYRYRVFSYHVADAAGRIYTTSFADRKEYGSFLDLITQSSYIDTKLSVGRKDKTITLSTCTSEEENRFVVHAKYMGEVLENGQKKDE